MTPNPEEGYINALRSFELDATDLEKVSNLTQTNQTHCTLDFQRIWMHKEY